MSKKVIAITSCPTGVAHTYMADEALENAAKEMGVDIKVETHGSVGIENKLSQQDIDEAEGLIIAADTNIEKSRFGGKQIIEVPVRTGIDKPKELIQDTLDQKGRVHAAGQTSRSDADESEDSGSVWKTVYRSLMNGVSHMIPFVVTGGLLIAVSLSIGGTPTEAGFVIPEGTFWYHINNIGGAAMGFMGPILGAYIAYAIADRPGLVPGMVGGFIAMNGSFYASEANTGFIGAIIAGFIAGYAALGIKKIPVPRALDSVMPIIFIPILSTLVVALIFIYLIGQPVAGLFTTLTDWLAGLQGANAAILGAVLGAMIAVDMGGPFNKTAFLLGSGLIAQGEVGVMGANAVAICIPPLAVGIASFIYKNKFTEADRSTGIASIIMGFFGITEGAIPFAAKNPLAVIPSIVIGSAVGGSIGMMSGVGDHVAHGGPIVAVLGAIDNVPMYFVAVLIGTIVSVILVGLFMPTLSPEAVAMGEETMTDDSSEGEMSVSAGTQHTVGEPEAVEPEASTTQARESEEVSLVDLTDEELIVMDVQGDHKDDVFKELISLPALDRYITDKEAVLEAVLTREAQGSTGMGDGIAIPHAKSAEVAEATLIVGRSDDGVEWDSMDGQPAKIIFLILVPEHQKGDLHLKILQLLARNLMHEDFKQAILNANTREEIYHVLEQVQ